MININNKKKQYIRFLVSIIFVIICLIPNHKSYSCKEDLLLNTCTGHDAGTKCYHRFYWNLGDTKCQYRNKQDPNCVKYINEAIDDGNCRYCREGWYVVEDTRVTPNTWKCEIGTAEEQSVAGCKFGTKYKENNSTWLLCYACLPGFFPVYYNTIGA